MRVLVLALALCLAPAAQAWFVFIPGGLIDGVADAATGSEGQHCVPSTAKVGDLINAPGGSIAVVRSLSGTSYRCKEPQRPIRARLEIQLPDNVRTAEHTVCLPMGKKAGDTAMTPDLGEVQVIRVQGVTGCGVDMKMPVTATVKSTQQPFVAPQAPTPAPSPVQTPVAAGKGVADRLRELKQLRDENLITAEQYEAKQREILAGQ